MNNRSKIINRHETNAIRLFEDFHGNDEGEGEEDRVLGQA